MSPDIESTEGDVAKALQTCLILEEYLTSLKRRLLSALARERDKRKPT